MAALNKKEKILAMRPKEDEKFKRIVRAINYCKYSEARELLKTFDDKIWKSFLYSRLAVAALTSRDWTKLKVPFAKKYVKIRMEAVDDFDAAATIALNLKNPEKQGELIRDIVSDMAKAGMFEGGWGMSNKVKNRAWRALCYMHIAMEVTKKAQNMFMEARSNANKIRNENVRKEILNEISKVEKHGDIYEKRRLARRHA